MSDSASPYVVDIASDDQHEKKPDKVVVGSSKDEDYCEWSSSVSESIILNALSRTEASNTVENQRDLIFRERTRHLLKPRSLMIRDNLPNFYNDSESKLAFLLVVFGASFCAPLLCVNFMFVRSPNKKARDIARLSVCMSIPFFLLVLTTSLAVFSPGKNSLSDMMEVAVAVTTCRDSVTTCCAGEGSLQRYVEMCADAGIVDPTGRICRYDLSPCVFINVTVGNTTNMHCHGKIDEKKTICHKHRARHVTGKEPGEL